LEVIKKHKKDIIYGGPPEYREKKITERKRGGSSIFTGWTGKKGRLLLGKNFFASLSDLRGKGVQRNHLGTNSTLGGLGE